MDIGKLIGKAILDVSQWVANADAAISAINDLSAAAAAVGAATAAGIGALAGIGVEVASNADRATTALGVMMKDADAAGKLMADIRKLAAATPFESADLVAGAQSLMSMGFAASEVIPTLTALGDAAAAAPAGMQAALPAIVRAFGQIRAKGKVSMEELYQLGENGVGAIGMIAESLGVTVAEAMERVSSGGLDAATGLNALMQGIERDLGGMMAKQSQTLDGVLSTLSDTFKTALGDAARPLVDALIQAIPVVSQLAGAMVAGLQPFILLMADATRYAGAMTAALNTLDPALVSMGATAAAVATLAVGGMGAIAVATLSIVPSALSAAAAVATLDAALAPILIIVGALGAAVSLLGMVFTATVAAVAIEWASFYAMYQADFLSIRSITSAAWSVLEAGIAIVGGLASAFAGAAKGWLQSIGLMGDGLSDLTDGAQGAAGSIGGALSAAMATASATVADVLKGMRDGFLDMALSVIGALQQMVSVLASIPGMAGVAAQAAGKLTEATFTIAAARGSDLGAPQIVLPDIDLSALLPPDMAAAYRDYMAGMKGATTETASYANALAGMTSEAGKADGSGKESPEMKALRVELERMAEDLGRASDAIRKGSAGFSVALADVDAKIKLAATRETMRITGAASAAGAAIGGAIEQATEDYAAAMRARLASAAAPVGNLMLDALGGLGDAIGAAIEGFKTGGVAGAVTAALASLISQSESFKNLTASLGEMFTSLLTGLDPLIQGIGMVLVPVMNLFGSLMGALAPAFKMLGQIMGMIAPALAILAGVFQGVGLILEVVMQILEPIMPVFELAFRVLFNVLKVVALIVMGVALALGAAWNGILEVIARVVSGLSNALGGIEALDKMAAALRDQKVDTAGMADAMADLATTTYDQAYASASAASSAAMMAEAANEATESLTNVPSGYKIALARFNATEATQMGGAASGMSSGAQSGGIVITGQVVVVADDPKTFLEKLQDAAETATFRYSGTAFPLTAARYRYGTP